MSFALVGINTGNRIKWIVDVQLENVPISGVHDIDIDIDRALVCFFEIVNCVLYFSAI